MKSAFIKSVGSAFLATVALFMAAIASAQINKPNGNQQLPAATALIPAPSTYPVGTKVNWIKSHTIVTPISNPADIANLGNGTDHIQTNYTDGLGRTIQSVAQAEGQSWGDIVQPVYYDEFGRQPSQRLPYIDPSGDGLFKKNAFPDAQAFNAQKYPGEQAYYSATLYDDATLSRYNTSLQPGASYAGIKHGAISSVRLNTVAENVAIWDYVNGQPVAVGSWADGKLYVSELTGGDGTHILQYKDREGKLILTKKEAGTLQPLIPHQGWLCTYYVYDEMNRLRCVIPPKAVETLELSFWAVTTTMQDNLCYSYDYDARGRITRKKLPGRAPILIVFDEADRPVLVQDGNLAASNAWMLTKYDVLGRVILTGKFLNSPGLSQQDIITDLESATTTNSALNYIKTKVYNPAYNNNTNLPDIDIYSISLFDTYDNAPNMPYCDAVVQALPGSQNNITQSRSLETMGMPTGGYIRVMNGTAATNTWESAVSYYDTHGRMIQTRGLNYKGGYDTVSMRYNFAGQLLSTISSISNPACTTAVQIPVIQTTMLLSYYGNGKLMSTSQKVNDEPYYRRINQLVYDELGRVDKKYLGGTAETQKYTYRVWGALEGINKAYCQSGGSNFFGEIISYDNGFDSINAAGMPSGLRWRLKGSGNTIRSYGYLYDRAGRLSTGFYTQNDGINGWSNAVENYTATGMRYDANGNFTAMKQWGTKTGYGVPFEMDKLRYDYNGLSNQLKAVTDTVTTDYGLGEFKELGGNTTADYTYDANGNATQDVNRNISSVTYNYHNKPVIITFNGGGRHITFAYNAAGTLLTKTISETGQPDKVIDYLGGAEYLNNTLTSVAHSEGKFRPILVTNTQTAATATAWEYDFFVKDHAGNVRSLLTEEPDANWQSTVTEASTGLTTLQPVTYDPTGGNVWNGYTVGSRQYTVTSELANSNSEESTFDNVGSTRDAKPGSTSTADQKDARLNAAEGTIIGPSIMLRVMAGDKLNIKTQAYYTTADDTSHASNATPAQLAQALLTALGGGGGYQTFNESGLDPELTYNGIMGSSFLAGMQSIKNHTTADGQRPQAFLNYLLLDDNMNVVSDQSGFVQTTVANSWNQLTVPEMQLGRSGYMIVFLSNESKMNVRFDNLSIVHYKGKLQEESHYYPYGLTITSKAFTGAAANNTLYQGKGLQKEEFSNGTGLDWYDFSARAYDAQVGMFHAYDPLAEGTPSLGGYVYCNDNPVVFSDPTGMKALKIEANDPDLAELTRANWNAINGMGWGCTGGGGGGGWGGYGSFGAMINGFGFGGSGGTLGTFGPGVGGGEGSGTDAYGNSMGGILASMWDRSYGDVSTFTNMGKGEWDVMVNGKYGGNLQSNGQGGFSFTVGWMFGLNPDGSPVLDGNGVGGFQEMFSVGDAGARVTGHRQQDYAADFGQLYGTAGVMYGLGEYGFTRYAPQITSWTQKYIGFEETAASAVNGVGKAFKIGGRALFVVSAAISIGQGVDAFYRGDYAGAAKSGVDIGMGAVGVWGGPVGLAVSAAYFLVDSYYPDGWKGLATDYTDITEDIISENRKLDPHWQLFPKDY